MSWHKHTVVMGVFALVAFAPLPAQESHEQARLLSGFIGETEVRYWDSSKAWQGYTLFAAHGRTYLIDMEGRVVHTWAIGTNPRLLDNGHLLDASRSDPSGFSGFKELDWDGTTVWEYTERRAGYFPHHDWVRIFNRKLNAYTTLYIANRTVTRDQAIAAGADPASSTYNDVQVDAIVEVDMAGNVVWEWWFFDHTVQDFDSTRRNWVGTGSSIADWPGRINVNMPGKPLRKDWLHCNSIDYHDSLGHIVINSVHGELYIIDHDGTFVAGDPAASVALAAGTGGDFLYRFGDPARYNQGDPPSVLPDWTTSTTGDKQIGGSHDVHWIRPGLPGAGNLQIFNNGEYLFERVSQSYIFDINPYLNARKQNTGAYVNPPDAGYYTWVYENRDAMKQNKRMSNQIVWIFCARNAADFFSTIGGSEQRLPNGNTLICSDTQGHLFEVTSSADPEIVWEYISPVTTDGIKEVISNHDPMYNSVFRAYRYAADHAGLAGHSLAPGRTITGSEPDYLRPADVLSARLEAVSAGCTVQSQVGSDGTVSLIGRTVPSTATTIRIVDLLGRHVSSIPVGMTPSGAFDISVSDVLSPGYYHCILESGRGRATCRLVIPSR